MTTLLSSPTTPEPCDPPAAVTFWIPGTPATAGSKRGFVVPKTGRVVVTEDCRRSRPWRATVAGIAAGLFPDGPLDGPLAVTFEFALARPKGHYRTGRNAHLVRPSAPAHPTSKPDTTKLVRAVEDALTSVAWRDDAQVVEQRATKRYARAPGVRVTIRRLVDRADPPRDEMPCDVKPPDDWPEQLGRSAEPSDLENVQSLF
jgi:Holliday junction resolvase RusA-like endonuclease